MKKTTAIDLDKIIKDFMQLEHVRPLNVLCKRFKIKHKDTPSEERNVVIKVLCVAGLT